MLLRPMRREDVPLAERLSAESFYDLDVRTHRPGLPEPRRRPPARADNWLIRTRHFLDTDPGGCWVAEVDGDLIGFATSFVREKTWFLATFAVRPGLQGRGLGKQLLDAALQHGRGCLRGMLSASSDPRAARRYRLAGFSLHPQMFLCGTVDRTAIPLDTGRDRIREGGAGDVDLLDSLDRQTRGCGHGPDHPLMLASWRLLVTETSTGSGYAYVDPGDGGLALLAASNRRTAARLLWAVLADTSGQTEVPHLTAANEWAIDVGMAARLELHQEGYLGLRGMRPPTPYVHNGALL